MKANNNSPAIRFAGYTDAWERRKLGDIAQKFIGGGTPQTSNVSYWNGEIPWFQSSDFREGTLSVVHPNKYISNAGLHNSAAQLIPANSIAIVVRVGVGKLALVPFSYATSQDFVSLCNLAVYPAFCVYSIYHKLQGELKNVQGTAIKGITKDDLLSKCVSVARSENEQKQIAILLKHMDNLITLHQRKYEKLVNLKKAMLDKMFPKNGELVPEVRFSGFSGNWERRRMGGIAEIVGGGTPSTMRPEYWNGNIDWYAPAEMEGVRYAKQSTRRITELGLHNSSARILPAEKTVLFTSRAGIGKMAILKRPGATNQGFQSMILKNGNSAYFIYSLRDIITAKAERIASGSTFLEISARMLANIEILVPGEQEQRAIGHLFEKVDDLIESFNRKIGLLQKLKSAFLEKMFV